MNLYSKEDYVSVLSSLIISDKINATTTKICCPLHVEKTPSCSINLDKGIFHCFGCGEAGTLNSLVYKLSGKSIKAYLNGKISEKIIENNNCNTQTVDLSRLDSSLNIVEGKLEHIQNNQFAYDHLINDRLISDKHIKYYQISFAEYVKINNSCFYNRIMIPMFYNDHIVNFEARSIPIYKQKSKVLFVKDAVKPLFDFNNLEKFSFQEPTKKVTPLMITEGLMDTLKIKTWCYNNVTCVSGNHLTNIQKKLITDNFKDIIVVPDNDEQGEVLIHELGNLDINLYICKLPEQYKDAGKCPITILEKTLNDESNYVTYEDFFLRKK